MAGKMSVAMQGLRNFLRQEARMTKPETRQILQELQGKQGFDDNVAQTLTAHLRDKFKTAMGGPNASHADPDNLKPFLGVGNLGGEIWQRGQSAGTFNNEWTKRNFAQYSNLNSYNKYFHRNLSDAVRGQTVNYNDIGTKLERERELDRFVDGRMLDEQAAREERIAEGLEAPTPEAARAEAARARAEAQERVEERARLKREAEAEQTADLIESQYDDPSVQEAHRISEATGDIKAQYAPIADRQMKAYEAGQRVRERERERQQFARDMGIEKPNDLSLESMDRVKANIRENLDKASQGGSVNQIFLNQLDKDGAIRARQAALDNVNERIAAEQKAFRDYDNVLHEKIQEDGAIEDMYDTYDRKAKLTDDQIKGSENQELIKAERAFAQNPTADSAVKDYVDSMRQLGQDADTAQAFGNAYAARARMLQAEAEKKGLENVGSGKTLQETAAGSAQEAAVADAAADFTGVLPTYEQAMAGNGKISLDRAMLRERMGGDPTDWGYNAAAEHLAKEQEKFLGKRVEAINKSKASAAEKNKMYNDAVATVQKNISEGPGMSNYFFGNQLHTGAVGAAAIMGTMGVAFGGRKSNAELYSSPF